MADILNYLIDFKSDKSFLSLNKELKDNLFSLINKITNMAEATK